MKKSLLALAALSTIAGVAQAQSSVTLYGTMDASFAYVQNAGQADSTKQITPTPTMQPNGTAGSGSTASFATGNLVSGLVDGAFSSSVWGLKGSEDLGGGMKAIFQAEGDLSSNNGGTMQNGLFRRGAFVGLQGGFGEITLGLRGNPLVASHAGTMPVSNNSFNVGVKTAMGFGDDFTKNALTYVTPVMNGLQATIQYGASNTVDQAVNGTALIAAATYVVGNFDARIAYQTRNGIDAAGGTQNPTGCPMPAVDLTATSTSTTTPSAGTATTTTTTALACSPAPGTTSSTFAYMADGVVQSAAVASPAGNKTTYLAGMKYKVSPALQVGVAWVHNDYSSLAQANTQNNVTSAVGQTLGAGYYSINALELGVGYQASPNLLVGANYAITTQDSSLYQLVATYSLSKRTNVYAMVDVAQNGAGAYQGSGAAVGNFQPFFTNTTTSPTANITGGAALPNTTQSGVAIGVKHTF